MTLSKTQLVSVPARGIMNLNVIIRFIKSGKFVSVPARGIMNLNVGIFVTAKVLERFRPRSGNYESEYCYRTNEQTGEFVSVPARGIMNLNNPINTFNYYINCFRPRSGNYESEYTGENQIFGQ